jgi:curli production assembly/transport component CsgG/holdfast attachment protein HfaB
MVRLHKTLSAVTIPALLVCILGGCATTTPDPKTGLYAKPLGGAPATANPTPYSAALTCLGDRADPVRRPRIAVGALSDLTGKRDFATGAKLTQGAGLFALTAFSRAGFPLVERGDLVISDAERAYAQAHMLSDNPSDPVDPERYRAVFAGEIAGSDYYLSGGLTELNYNIRSSGVDAAVGATEAKGLKGALTHSTYVISVAADLRLIRTRSQEIVAVASYQKEIIGRETKPGVFDFADGVVIDVSGGKSALEPLQLGVRTVIERAVYDFAAQLYAQAPAVCLSGQPVPATVSAQSGQSRPGVRPTALVAYDGPFLDKRTWTAPGRGGSTTRAVPESSEGW